ncbi:MAG: response regulator transcription factor [Rhodocyclales bacterium]|jgi:DNA-binding LytR/AlgR family response regulator|nr:response regulator transcription factor [Rhodocyclales bacterium]CAG0988824.1 Transcriptional regulatory protein BtsR [Rhodocyclaceae bacterium]
MSPTALIADDEPLLAEDLRRRLAVLWPELGIVAICHDGPAALARLEADKPEIAFLDIRMPGLSGLEVAARLDYPCQVVFVTAYDQYAVEAFEKAAIDYVLKPADEARLAKTIGRLRRAIRAPSGSERSRLAEALEKVSLRGTAQPAPLKWIRASVGDAVRLVPVAEVRYFQAADKYTAVMTAAGELLIRTPIKELAEQLDAESFWQVHRGTIVNARYVSAARHDESGRVLLSLRDRPETLTVSRAYAHLFRQM